MSVTEREDFDFVIRLPDRIFPSGKFLHTVETNTGTSYGVIRERQLCRPDGSVLATNHPEELECYRPFLREFAQEGGTVLLLGAGLGLMLSALLRMERLQGITVVEHDLELKTYLEEAYSQVWWVNFVHGDAFKPEEWIANEPFIQHGNWNFGFASIWSNWDPQVVAPQADRLRELYAPYLQHNLTCDREDWVREQVRYNEEVPRHAI